MNRNWKQAMWRGIKLHCPNCDEGQLMKSYVKTNEACPHCGEELHHHRADDAPPYFTMTIVAHIIVPAMLLVEKFLRPDLWIHFVTWIPLTLLLTLWLMPRVKGSIVGLQWALKMHGFSGQPE